MARTLFYRETRPYIFNYWRHEELGDGLHIVTTEHGGWAVLDEREWELFKTHRIEEDPELFFQLEDAGIILTQKNIDTVIDDTRKKYSFLFSGPSLHIVAPTLACNHRCIYCQIVDHDNPNPKRMDEDTAKKIVEFMFRAPNKCLTIEFQGGEPLLHFDAVRTIVDHALELNKKYKKDLDISVVTNLTPMDEEKLVYLVENRVGICTSLDGPKEVHDKNRKYLDGRGSYDDVVYWIKRIKQAHPKLVHALMVTTRYSLPYWREIIDEYARLDIRMIQVKEMNRLGFAQKTWEKIGYTPREFVDFWRKSVDYAIERYKKGSRVIERFASLVARKMLYPRDPGMLDLRSPCGAAIGQLAYDHDGNIYTCDEARGCGEPFILGNVHEHSYTQVMTSRAVGAMVKASMLDSYVCDACPYKPWCGVCPVVAYGNHGNIVVRVPEHSRCTIYKEMFRHVARIIATMPGKAGVLQEWALTRDPYEPGRGAS